MKIEQLRYIVFLIDTKYKDHDGKVFLNLADARLFCKDVIEEKYADKIVIGTFLLSTERTMNIRLIETYGFKLDVKNINQLDLFK